MEGSCGDRNGLTQVEHTSAVFRRVQQELLAIEITNLGMSLHHNARACAVHPTLPGAAQAGHPTTHQLIGVFAEVPDISVLVLSEPIERIFSEFAVDKDLVVNFDAGDSVNELRVSGNNELGVNKALRSRPLVYVSCSRFQGEVGIIDSSGEIGGIDCGIVWPAT